MLHAPPADPEVRAITVDSRNVRPGTLFVALRGHSEDGHRYLRAARDAGAVAALVEQRDETLGHWPQVVVTDTRMILGAFAHEVYGHPTDSVSFMGVTGTNGKTSVVHFLEAIARAAGRVPGVSGRLKRGGGGSAFRRKIPLRVRTTSTDSRGRWRTMVSISSDRKSRLTRSTCIAFRRCTLPVSP